VAAKVREFADIPRWVPRVLEPREIPGMRLLDIRDVCDRVRLSRAQVYEMMAEGRFPRPIKYSPGRRGSVRWPDIWVNDWLESVVESATRRQQEVLAAAAQVRAL
jgi:prophage regulatory protein